MGPGAVAQDIGQRHPDIDTVVDFGVGDKLAIMNKVLPIIRGLDNVKMYAGIDVSEDFLKAACKRVSEGAGILATPINGDFYKDRITLPGRKKLGLMLGSTITNQNMKEGDDFPRAEIVSKLSHIKQTMGAGNHMIFTYDSNPDPDSAMNAYDHVFWSRHVTGMMYEVNKYAEGNVKPSAGGHKMVGDSNAHVIHQCSEATENQNFSIDGHDFHISKGERFVTVNNFKYPLKLFQDLCEEAGFNIGKSHQDHQNRMRLQMLSIA